MKKLFALMLALVLIASLAVSVSAVSHDSPTPVSYYDVSTSVVGTGEAGADPIKVVVNSDGTSTLTAVEVEGGGAFVRWELVGEYEIVEGSLTSKVLVIKPLSDVKASAVFKDAGKDTGKKNDSSTSPKTGDMSMIIVTVMLLAAGAAVFAVKKIKE